MAEQSAISWTDATFNPWWGCWPVSPGRALCYAEREARRYGYGDTWSASRSGGERRVFGEKHWNEPLKWARTLPAKLGRRPRVFCASMADIGEDHPTAAAERPKLWQLIEKTPELDWLLLTKRTATAERWLPASWVEGAFPLNVWFGFSAENQEWYDERVRQALVLPARVIYVSYEPALGPIDFRLDENRLDWVIAGGESAHPAKKARPASVSWFRSARDQCLAAGVAFHFKQWGEWGPVETWPTGTASDQPWNSAALALVGRRVAGRLLDGRTWDEFPASVV